MADLQQRCGTVQKMIVGCGVDMIEIARIAEAFDRYGERFSRRVFLPAEVAYCRRKRNAEESFAARFAAKEAAAKALGTGIHFGVSWRDIEVVRAPSGKPSILFHGRAAARARGLGAKNAAISITHSRTCALAYVVLET